MMPLILLLSLKQLLGTKAGSRYKLLQIFLWCRSKCKNREELGRLFKEPALLKHRIALILIYSGSLRSQEASNMKISDIDFERKTIHIRQSKYKKDRFVPLFYYMAKELSPRDEGGQVQIFVRIMRIAVQCLSGARIYPWLQSWWQALAQYRGRL